MKILVVILTILFSSISTLHAEGLFQKHSPHNSIRLLIFTKTQQDLYIHKVTATAVEAIKNLADRFGVQTTVSNDSSIFSTINLDQFQTVIFINNNGDILGDIQKNAIQNFIKSGKGIVVLHGGILANKNWPWFEQLIGAKFADHPQIQHAKLTLATDDHPVNKGLPQQWQHRDEWYNFVLMPVNIEPLILIDESSYQGGTHGVYHPIAWIREHGAGRVFYSAMGHTEESWANEIFLQHIANGISYATKWD